MKTKQIFLFTLFLGYSLLSNAQWITTGNNIYYSKGNVGIKTTSPTEALTVAGEVAVGTHTKVWGGYGTKLYLRGVGNADDEIYMVKYSRYTTRDETELRINLGDDRNGEDRVVIGNYLYNTSNSWRPFFVVQNDGKVGINNVNNPRYELEVNGTIRAKELKLESTGWSDFVFEDDYELPTLEEVASHIKEKKHLPGIPSAKEVEEEGFSVNEMNAKLLQKIEELTLYAIKQQGEIEELKSFNKDLMNKITTLVVE